MANLPLFAKNSCFLEIGKTTVNRCLIVIYLWGKKRQKCCFFPKKYHCLPVIIFRWPLFLGPGPLALTASQALPAWLASFQAALANTWLIYLLIAKSSLNYMKLWWWKNNWLYDCTIFLHINKHTLSSNYIVIKSNLLQLKSCQNENKESLWDATRHVTQGKITVESQWKFHHNSSVFSQDLYRISTWFLLEFHWKPTEILLTTCQDLCLF